MLAEIRMRGYKGSYSHLARLVSPWRHLEAVVPKSEADPLHSAPTMPAGPAMRHVSPQVAAALLCKRTPELTNRQADVVRTLKSHVHLSRLCDRWR